MKFVPEPLYQETFCQHVEALIRLMEQHLALRIGGGRKLLVVECVTCHRTFHFRRNGKSPRH